MDWERKKKNDSGFLAHFLLGKWKPLPQGSLGDIWTIFPPDSGALPKRGWPAGRDPGEVVSCGEEKSCVSALWW